METPKHPGLPKTLNQGIALESYAASYHSCQVYSLIKAFQEPIHCSKFTWKWGGAPFKTTVLCIRAPMGFHVNLGQGIWLVSRVTK